MDLFFKNIEQGTSLVICCYPVALTVLLAFIFEEFPWMNMIGTHKYLCADQVVGGN